MRCAARDLIVKEMLDALRAYDFAVRASAETAVPASIARSQQIQKTRRNCERLHSALSEHDRVHRCAALRLPKEKVVGL
jgi:hypothetical protein